MTWSAPQDTPPTVRIAAHRSAMLPSERRVADAIAAQPESLVELTAQELAERIGNFLERQTPVLLAQRQQIAQHLLLVYCLLGRVCLVLGRHIIVLPRFVF